MGASVAASLFARLNPEQRAAVEHPPARPLLLVAGAGAGKTLTLAARVARLVLDGADPQRLLLLTFSRRAAQELERRAAHAVRDALGLAPSRAPPRLPWAGTFHGVAARLLHEHAAAIGLAPEFTILDRADAEDLLALQRDALGLGSGRQRFPLKGTCVAIYSRVVNSAEPLDAVLRRHFPWCAPHADALKGLFGAYAREKQRQQLLDYDDLLLYWSRMMAEPRIGAALATRFDHLLVDEYQDTNRLQAAIVRALRPDGSGVTVVGDDAQAIYGFRAAELRNILDFPAQYTPPAAVLTLQRNYRSTPAILDAANAVIRQAGERHAKELWSTRSGSRRPQLVTLPDEAAQAAWVADRVLAQREAGVALKRQAALFRSAQHSAALELELARRRIPFVKFGGLRFLESAHVKDLLSLLRWAHNPRHALAAWRVVQLIPGIGAAHARRLLDALAAADDADAALQRWEPPAAARDDWARLRAVHAALRRSDWPRDVGAALDWYRPLLERLHDDAAPRLADLLQLQQLAAAHGSRERFLAELTLDPPAASSDEAGEPLRDEDYLILSTIHAAKGQEWNAVYLLNVVDGCLPSDLAGRDGLDEELRLLYVAMTRARDHLELLVPQRFYVTQQAARGDRHVYALPSRFVTPAVAALCDAVAPAAATADAAAAALPAAPGLAGSIAAMWD